MAYTYNYKLNGEETIFKPQQQLFIFEFSVISTALKFLLRERHLICMKCFFLKGMTLVKRNASLPGVTEFCIVIVALLWLLNAIWSTLLSLQYCSECSSLCLLHLGIRIKIPYHKDFVRIKSHFTWHVLLNSCCSDPFIDKATLFYTHTHMHKRGN